MNSSSRLTWLLFLTTWLLLLAGGCQTPAPMTSVPPISTSPVRDGPKWPETADVASNSLANAGATFEISSHPEVVGKPEDLLHRVVGLDCLTPSAEKGKRSKTSGSMVVTSDESGITNNHVVGDCIEGTLRAFDIAHHRVPAFVISSDRHLDIALVRFDHGLDATPVTWGSSTAPDLGSTTWVAGNSAGRGLALTRGILSGRNRNVERMLSTDAAINPGNSGGPIFDEKFRLIGMMTLKERAEGISYAIPVEQVRKFAEELSIGGVIKPAWFGLVLGDEPHSIDYPVIVRGVKNDSPAEQHGIQVGDRIVSIGEAEVKTSKAGQPGCVQDLLKRVAIGDSIEWVIVRDGKTISENLEAVTPPSH